MVKIGTRREEEGIIMGLLPALTRTTGAELVSTRTGGEDGVLLVKLTASILLLLVELLLVELLVVSLVVHGIVVV